jgi:hypothetical protein
MKAHYFLAFLIGCWLPVSALADDRLVRVAVPEVLLDSGLMKHILPRFSLKTQIKVHPVEAGDTSAEMSFGTQGRPVFEGAGQVWNIAVAAPDHPGTKRFVDWLFSDVGRNTVTSFAPHGTVLFTLPAAGVAEVQVLEYDGDRALGLQVSQAKCGRCHAVSEAGRKKSIGSTPSFFVLRGFADWDERFSAFYTLKPHPSFTQVEDVTEPFPPNRPPPIFPIQVTLDELEDILAYVAILEPADLGAPLQHQ